MVRVMVMVTLLPTIAVAGVKSWETPRSAEFPALLQQERFEVVMLNVQPCVMLPESNDPSSCT